MNFFEIQKSWAESDADAKTILGLIDRDPFSRALLADDETSLEEAMKRLEPLHNDGPFSARMSFDITPLGTIRFVETRLKDVGVAHMWPTEIPPCLRQGCFLGRRYGVVSGNPSFPEESGAWLIKDAANLKAGGWRPQAAHRDGLWAVSERIEILSEWRLIYFGGKIQCASNYDGDPMLFPDAKLCREMLAVGLMDPSFPQAGTIDIGIIADGSEERTVLIETHPLVSCGLYSTVWGTSLLRALADGYRWYLSEWNRPCAQGWVK